MDVIHWMTMPPVASNDFELSAPRRAKADVGKSQAMVSWHGHDFCSGTKAVECLFWGHTKLLHDRLANLENAIVSRC